MTRRSLVRHKRSRLVIGGFILIAFLLVFSPFLIPILLASLFAFALNPYIERVSRTLSSKKTPTVALLFFLFFGVTLPIAFVSWRVVSKVQEYSVIGFENTGLFLALRKVADRAHSALLSLALQFGLNTTFDTGPDAIFAKIGPLLVNGAASLMSQFPSLFFSFLVFCVMLYFFITESKNIKAVVSSLDLLKRTEVDRIIRVIERSSFTALVSASLVGTIQSLTVSIMATICGYHEFLIIYLVTFVLSFIPVIGAAPVAALLSLLSFIQHDYASAITLAITAAFVGSIDNVIKHYVLRTSENKVHPIIDLLAIIGAVIFYGIPGLFLGPVLTRLAIYVTPILLGFEEPRNAK